MDRCEMTPKRFSSSALRTDLKSRSHRLLEQQGDRWGGIVSGRNGVARPVTDLPKFGLGYSGTELCTQLVQAVLRGEKTATAGLAEEEESPPRAGDRYLLHDAGEQAVGIIEVTEARIVPAGEIDLDFARDEIGRASCRERV